MPRTIRYDRLPTEQANPRSRVLDTLSVPALLRLMNREEIGAVRAVGRVIPQVGQAVRLIADVLRKNGRLFFVGAGTSGRLGIIEAAECPPTFSTAPSMVQAIMAGGRGAVFRSREGAEDRRADARRLIRQRVRRGDVVVGIAASGVTPFVDEALQAARSRDAATILVTGHPGSRIPCTVRIAFVSGPEVLSGSTRLKAGTATKLILNMLTLGAMVQLGKTYGHWMVDVRPTSRKLRARAHRLVQTLAGCTSARARQLLRRSGGRVKVAVLLARGGSAVSAAKRLARVDGSLRRALARRD